LTSQELGLTTAAVVVAVLTNLVIINPDLQLKAV
jgi:hypothetical protein